MDCQIIAIYGNFVSQKPPAFDAWILIKAVA